MVSAERPHVLYLGDWVFHVGPVFIETPFALETKDCDLHFYGQRLSDAFRKDAEVTCWQIGPSIASRPESWKSTSTARRSVMISDVEAKCFHLYPNFFDRARA